MSLFKIAAMNSAAKISSRKCRQELMKHLRHHFGKHCFEPGYKVQMLCDGHPEVTSNSIEYAYESGGIKETVDYSVKNMADEMADQLARQLNSKGVLPDMIERVDVVLTMDVAPAVWRIHCWIKGFCYFSWYRQVILIQDLSGRDTVLERQC